MKDQIIFMLQGNQRVAKKCRKESIIEVCQTGNS